MSDKQLSQTVKYGRKITFQVFDGEPVVGYLAGMDEHYFLVLIPQKDGFRKVCVARLGCPSFELHPEASYVNEPHHDQMEEIIQPFRSWLVNRVLAPLRDE
jgi:hypothetical protein